MSRLLALCLVVVALLPAAVVLAAEPPAPPEPGILPPTAPFADFNQPTQSSGLIAAMHIRGPEKIIGTAVVLLLLIALVMFIGMLRHVYGGGQRAPRR